MSFKLDDYVDVAERLRQFYEAYPEGSIVSERWEVAATPAGEYVVCEALAYRSADDAHPARGLAWEPLPGKTPYTKDSELMNAETSAWGRAIVAVGIPSRHIASREEVRNRQTSPETAPEGHIRASEPSKVSGGQKHLRDASDPQRAPTNSEKAAFHKLQKTLIEEGHAAETLQLMMAELVGKTSSGDLTAGEMRQVTATFEGMLSGGVA